MRVYRPVALAFLWGCAAHPADSGVPIPSRPNTAPTAAEDTFAATPGIYVELQVRENDFDVERHAMYITGVTDAEHGEVEILPGNLRVGYTPDDDAYDTTDSFDYTLEDELGGTASATVTVEIGSEPTLIITEPAFGDVVTGPDVVVSFEVEGCNVSYPSDDADGCHVHKFLDGIGYEEGGSIGHYERTSFEIEASTGTHEFRLVLTKNDGSEAPWEPSTEDAIVFEVQ